MKKISPHTELKKLADEVEGKPAARQKQELAGRWVRDQVLHGYAVSILFYVRFASGVRASGSKPSLPTNKAVSCILLCRVVRSVARINTPLPMNFISIKSE